jgi:HSP20 family molecular chaperone IbpA
MTDTTVNGPEVKAPARGAAGEVWTPCVDILEKQDGLMLSLEMPGVKADAVEIHFERGELTVKAERAAREARGRPLLREFGGGGTYYRAFLISQDVAADRISAELKDGVLSIHLPRAEAARPRRIALSS